VALRQEVAAQAVGDLAGIDPVVLLLGRRNRLSFGGEIGGGFDFAEMHIS